MSSGAGWYGYGYGYYGGCTGRWTHRLRGVVVSMRHGFELDEVGELTALCCQLVTRTLAAPHGYMTGETSGSTSVTYGGRNVEERPGSMSLLAYEQGQLYTYRIPGRRAA
jgi:hypothetical protein